MCIVHKVKYTYFTYGQYTRILMRSQVKWTRVSVLPTSNSGAFSVRNIKFQYFCHTLKTFLYSSVCRIYLSHPKGRFTIIAATLMKVGSILRNMMKHCVTLQSKCVLFRHYIVLHHHNYCEPAEPSYVISFLP